ncbi:MAG: helix-turn-helix transcriptional regulator [Desulfosalsimonadaceae bacterium]
MLRLHIEKMERERERLGLSKAEIERRAKLKKSTYSKIIERRATSISTLNRLADALYLDPKDLLTN